MAQGTPSVSLTSYTLVWNGSYDSGTNIIYLDYSSLDFSPSVSDIYKSTSGDIFKVYINGVRIYRQSDDDYDSGEGFLEPADKASGVTWTNTSDTVWSVLTVNSRVELDRDAIRATTLYHPTGSGSRLLDSDSDVAFTTDSIIELRRSVQDESTPAIDYSNASILTEQDLDNASKNVFHMGQQAIIQAEKGVLYDIGAGVYSAFEPGGNTAKRITNLATPTGDTDATTKAYVDVGTNVPTVATSIASVNTVATSITNVNTLATGKDGSTSTSGDNLNIRQIDVVADNISDVSDVANINTNVTKVADITTGDISKVANITTGDVSKVANITTGDVTKVASITTGDVTKVADIDSEVSFVAAVDGEVALASAADGEGALVSAIDGEIALLGTSAMAHATTGHLALLGTSAMANTTNGYLKVLGNSTVIADMAILADTDITDDMAILGSTTVTDDMAILADTDITDDMAILGASGVVGNITTVATNIDDVNNFVDTYFGSDDSSDGPTGTFTEGDLYFSTYDSGSGAENKLKVRNSSNSWQNATTTVEGVLAINEDNTGNGSTQYYAFTHDCGLEMVFLNGVRMIPETDYKRTSADSNTTHIADGGTANFIYFVTAPALSDNISLMAFGNVTSSVIVPKSGGTFTGYVTIPNLTVTGTTTTIDTATLTVDDKNIDLGSFATPTDTTADGGGITLKGATDNDKTIIWDNAQGNWTTNQDWNLATGKVIKENNTAILSRIALGSTVLASGLTSVGTLTGLRVTGAGATVGRTYDIGSYATDDFDLMVTNAGNDATAILLYNNAGAYNSGILEYHNNVFNIGLNDSNAAPTIRAASAISISDTGVGIGDTSPTEGKLVVKELTETQPAIHITHTGAGRSFELFNSTGGTGMYIQQNYANYGLEINMQAAAAGILVSGASAPHIAVQDTTNTVTSILQCHDDRSWVGTTTNHALHFITNNTERIFINSSGDVGVGVTPSVGKFVIKGGGTGTDNTFITTDSLDVTTFYVRDDGQIFTPEMDGGSGDYDVHYVSGGQLRHTASTRRVKNKERELEIDTSDIYKMTVKSFNWDLIDQTHSDMGLIAEDVQGINEFFVVMDYWKDETELSSTAVRTQRIMWAMLAEMQKLNEKVIALENA